jgi:hypothetical protein
MFQCPRAATVPDAAGAGRASPFGQAVGGEGFRRSPQFDSVARGVDPLASGLRPLS